MKPLLALFTAAALGLAASAHADTVFKWVDANGVTNYTTTPPTGGQKVSAVNASPALASLGGGPSAAAEEALYWRERRQRETANDIGSERNRRESEELRNQLARQQMGAAYDEEQRRKAEEARRQAAYDQCMLDRRLDCVYGSDYGSYGGYPVAVVGARRRPFTVPATQALPGQPPLTNPTPGAPHISLPPRPVDRPAPMTRRPTH